ncbi:MobB family relaxase [Sediminicola luteus]|uniref:Mobilization protein n=1 Tax=Sediminicola luteus TaxID=319238 RepID=A0A2A4G4W0_9FLAO|nr:MobB family relaxase [Sediminicola luteus]PCE63004.1 mobilization protein [Sediminicola luteus]
MHINISAQKLESTYTGSVRDYVTYLEKEEKTIGPEARKGFFNLDTDGIPSERVIAEIDGNTAKLKKKDPRFYSIVVSPSQRELKHIRNDKQLLKQYTRKLMEAYAHNFNRNQRIQVSDIMFFAKIEDKRTFRGFERQVLGNAPYHKEIVKLKNDMAKIARGEIQGNLRRIQAKIDALDKQAPYRAQGKRIVSGMEKPGLQTHVHIIVSRKDIQGKHILSPLSKYRASEVVLNGKPIKRGFDRNAFLESAEKTFDTVTGYNRNYVETYTGRKALLNDPKAFYQKILGLPKGEKAIALKLLKTLGTRMPVPLAAIGPLKDPIKSVKKGLSKTLRSAAIEY